MHTIFGVEGPTSSHHLIMSRVCRNRFSFTNRIHPRCQRRRTLLTDTLTGSILLWNGLTSRKPYSNDLRSIIGTMFQCIGCPKLEPIILYQVAAVGVGSVLTICTFFWSKAFRASWRIVGTCDYISQTSSSLEALQRVDGNTHYIYYIVCMQKTL